MSNDDLWLKVNGLLYGYPAKKVRRYSKYVFTVNESQKVSLSSINNGVNRNNEYLKNLLEHYDGKIDWDKLSKCD